MCSLRMPRYGADGSTVHAGGSGGDAPPGWLWTALACSRTWAGHPSPPCSVSRDSGLCRFCAPDLCLGSAPRTTGTLQRKQGKRPGAHCLCSLPRGSPQRGALPWCPPVAALPLCPVLASYGLSAFWLLPTFNFPCPELRAEPLPLGVMCHLHVISLYPVITFLSSPFT